MDTNQTSKTSNEIVISKIKPIVNNLIELFNSGQKYIENDKNKQYYSTIYDNYTFHINNMSTLLSEILTESQETITNSKRITYYSTFFDTIRKNIDDSIQKIQPVQPFIDPNDYSFIYNNFKNLRFQASLL